MSFFGGLGWVLTYFGEIALSLLATLLLIAVFVLPTRRMTQFVQITFGLILGLVVAVIGVLIGSGGIASLGLLLITAATVVFVFEGLEKMQRERALQQSGGSSYSDNMRDVLHD